LAFPIPGSSSCPLAWRSWNLSTSYALGKFLNTGSVEIVTEESKEKVKMRIPEHPKYPKGYRPAEITNHEPEILEVVNVSEPVDGVVTISTQPRTPQTVSGKYRFNREELAEFLTLQKLAAAVGLALHNHHHGEIIAHLVSDPGPEIGLVLEFPSAPMSNCAQIVAVNITSGKNGRADVASLMAKEVRIRALLAQVFARVESVSRM
jgi:hypothetical protein